MEAQTFEIDVTDCQSETDLYSRLLCIMAAPAWHGHNLDALWDSITSDINGLAPPYIININGHESLPAGVATPLFRMQKVFEEARNTESVDVMLCLE